MKKKSSEPIESPCNKDCRMGPRGYCLGCFRDIFEIANWQTLSTGERQRVLSELPARKAACRDARRT